MSISYRVARTVWWVMLWFMRRPVMKRLQRQSIQVLPERMRASAQRSLVRQNRWARRHGLLLLTFSFTTALLIVMGSVIYLVLGEFNARAIESSDPSMWNR